MDRLGGIDDGCEDPDQAPTLVLPHLESYWSLARSGGSLQLAMLSSTPQVLLEGVRHGVQQLSKQPKQGKVVQLCCPALQTPSPRICSLSPEEYCNCASHDPWLGLQTGVLRHPTPQASRADRVTCTRVVWEGWGSSRLSCAASAHLGQNPEIAWPLMLLSPGPGSRGLEHSKQFRRP